MQRGDRGIHISYIHKTENTFRISDALVMKTHNCAIYN